MLKYLLSLIFTILFFVCPTSTILAAYDNDFVEYSPQYETLSRFVDDVAMAKDMDQYHVITMNNNVLYKSDVLLSYKNGVYRIVNEQNVYLYDSSFRLITIFQGISSKALINNYIAILDTSLNTKLYNLTGACVLESTYQDIIYGNGNCVLLDNGEYIVVYDLNSKKNIITDIEKCTSVNDNYVICIKDGKYGIVDFNGNMVIDFKYSKISRELSSEYFYCLSGDMLDIYNDRFEKVGTVNISAYKSYKNLSEGLICVCNADGNYLYVDINGKVNIDSVSVGYNLTNCNPFYEGLAVISTANGDTYINKNGDLATDKLWDGAYRFANGYALVYNNVYDYVSEQTTKRWYIINTDFEVVKSLHYDVYVDPYYESSTDFSEGYIRTIDNETGLMGFIYLENYESNSKNQLKLSPTSLYQLDRTNQTLSEVAQNTTVESVLKHFIDNDVSLVIVTPNNKVLNKSDKVFDGCKVQLRSSSDSTVILDELIIKVSAQSTESDLPTLDPSSPNNSSFIDSIADKIGITSNQLLMIAGGTLVAFVLLIIVIVAIKRKRY